MQTISMKQHGASIKFKIPLRGADDGDISKEHKIHSFVIVRFKYTYQYPEKYISIAMKKQEKAIDCPFTVDVSSNILSFVASTNGIYCTEDWSDWKGASCNYNHWFVHVYIKINIIKKYPIIMQKIHEDDTFTDFELSADDGSVSVHKVYLSALCDVFKTMLSGQWKETAQGRVELPGVTRKTLQHFKDFMYLGTLPDDGLGPLLLIANRYLVEDFKAECMMKVIQTITPENLDSYIDFAAENEVHELLDAIFEYIPGSFFAKAKMHSLEAKKQSSSSSDEK